ncbi:NrdH-redoxin [Thermoplasmatales archaeon ex4484_6]|nr:MAG: NrdH-redoxin [Thermoplasmatales archaeon ex4484_6]
MDGEPKGDVKLFALSTCVWCRRTKRLLDSLGIGYRYIFMDLLDRETRDEVEKDVRRYNPRCSFPTLVIDDKRTIVGFQEEEIREAFENA